MCPPRGGFLQRLIYSQPVFYVQVIKELQDLSQVSLLVGLVLLFLLHA